MPRIGGQPVVGYGRGMVQLIFFVVGVLALVREEVNVTKNRVLPPGRARVLGTLLVLAALLGFVMPSMFPDSIVMILSYTGFGVVLAGLALAFSVPK